MARGSLPGAAAQAELAERLVDAALRVLAEHGSPELTVRRVAEEAGSSTMGVYSRFGGRPGLLEALYQRTFSVLTDALALIPATTDPLHDLSELSCAYRRFALDVPHRYVFMFSRPLPDFEPADGLHAEVLQAAFAPLIDAVHRAGAQGLAATRAAYCLWCVMHGLVGLELTAVLRAPLTSWGVSGEDGTAAERMYRAGVQAMLAGLELGCG
ncbi:TetR/AcrR family transcriptional regulator [Kitasatospora mediocidica]|uniref:TetR/AcrR family transcriptional regulator n=1 Tax=Kitasatospora mediocidica TaxID=58352 RepID=UPI00068B497A|nr:TetR/AcrR family transcriptional regulator [Kitasatospora mediocidica]